MSNDDVTTSKVVESLKIDIARLEKENDLLKSAPASVSDACILQRWIELCEKWHGATAADEMRAMLSAAPKAQAAQAQELPALPESEGAFDCGATPFYSAEQMRTYALEAIRAERDACERIVDAECIGFADDDAQLRRIIFAIRARSQS